MPLNDRDYMRNSERREPSWLSRWTPLHWIIAANIVVFIFQHVIADGTDGKMPLGGVSVHELTEGHVWTAFTYMFVHGGLMHLIGNLLLIGFVGYRVQGMIGNRNFTLLYFLAGLVGAGVQMVVETAAHLEPAPIIGASACGCGLFLAYAAMMPEERLSVMLYFIIPVTARMWTLAMFMIGIDAVLGTSSLFWAPAREWWGGLAYFAHIGGAVLGWYFVRMLGYSGYSIDHPGLMKNNRMVMRRAQRQQVARVRRERAAPDIDHDAAERRRRAEPGRVREAPVMEDVNEILDKISRDGMNSLSEEERRRLEAASRELAHRQQGGTP